MSENRDNLLRFITGVFPMPLGEAELIANHFSYRSFGKNELLLKEGRYCNEYYFLENGFIRSFTHDLEGNDITTAFYSKNQVVCELFSFFKRIPARENFETLTTCDTWYLTFDQLQTVFHAMPLFREFGRTILVNSYANLKSRMLSGLHQTAEERYADLLHNNPEIFQFAPLKQIATYLGITDTSLSRIRKEFVKHTTSSNNLSIDKSE